MCISFSIHSFVFFFPNVYVLYFSMLDANNTSFVCFLFILFVCLSHSNKQSSFEITNDNKSPDGGW